MTIRPSPDAIAQLAPTGKLRVGINHSNFLLSQHDAAGRYSGVAIDIAAELASRLGAVIEVVGFESPGLMAEAVARDAWDVAFMGAEPARAKEIAFSAAYLEIEAGYLVPPGSPIKDIAEVDRQGVRIALMDKSAYDLYLTRNIKHATIVRTPSIDASYETFVADKLEVLAGLKPRLNSDVKRLAGSRILDGRFTAIQQSVGAPRARGEAGAAFLGALVEELKASGFVGAAIAKHGVGGVSVAPPAA
jgi:polar amino acid transport system substrate-binding protein